MPEIISRKEARERGLIHYFTAVECKFGHLNVRTVSNGNCLTCQRKAVRRLKDKAPRELALRCDGPVPATGAQARLAGVSRYRTDRPCIKGHVSERFARGGGCVECKRERLAAKRKSLAKNPGARAEASRALKAALASGGRTYVGAPCLKGHSGERFTDNRSCVVCCRERYAARTAQRRQARPPKPPRAPKAPKAVKVARPPKPPKAPKPAPKHLPPVVNFANRKPATVVPTFPDATEIERFIAERGVTRCPTAMVALSSGTVSEADRAALAAHHAKLQQEWERQWKRRTQAGRRAA